MTQPTPKTWRERLNVGRTLQPAGGWKRWPNGKKSRGEWRCKFARRIERRRAFNQDSTIESALVRARATIAEAQSLATNSHEARRYIETLRREE